MSTMAAITVVEAGLPICLIRGDMLIRSRVADANTILARGAGQLAVGIKHAGEGRS